MTAEPYTPAELPGVIAELRSICDGIPLVTLTATTVDRLLATLEAMAADAEVARCAVAYVHIKTNAPQVAGEAYRDLCNAIDAARREGEGWVR